MNKSKGYIFLCEPFLSTPDTDIVSHTNDNVSYITDKNMTCMFL